MIFSLVLAISPVAYLMTLAFFLARKQWPIRAAAVSLIVALFPLIFLMVTVPTEHLDSPGTGFLLILTAVPVAISLLLLVVGSLLAALRVIRGRHLRAEVS